MYKYELSQGTPDGTDWVIDLEHKKYFSQEEFINEMEDAICETFEQEMKDPDALIYVSIVNKKILTKNLEKRGFVINGSVPTACYDFQPYCRDFESTNKLDVVITKIKTRFKKQLEVRRELKATAKKVLQ
jgi:hypothetical protein